MRARFSLGAGAVAVALALGACGDDEGRVTQETVGTETSPATTPTTTAPTQTTTAPAETEAAPGPSGDGGESSGGLAAPEQRPGGAGDEVAASVQALFTGRGGRISPRIVRVPPFIAVRVQLRSADGGAYELSGGGESLRVTGGRAQAEVFDGLRPQKRLVLSGTGGRVVVEASAEPGP